MPPKIRAALAAGVLSIVTLTGFAGTAHAAPNEPNSRELAKFMFAERQLNSGGNYRARSVYSTASGAYQYIDTTWNAPSRRAIWSRYGYYPRAYLAPSYVQDAVARFDYTNGYRWFRNWAQVAMLYYYPPFASDPSKWDRVPPGQRLTMRQYAFFVLVLQSRAPAR